MDDRDHAGAGRRACDAAHGRGVDRGDGSGRREVSATASCALSYQAAPAAMISLLLGLGVDLFKLLPQAAATPIKIAALAGAVVWGAALGWRILAGMGLRGPRAAAALLPCVAGGAIIIAAWWPAVIGG